MKMYFRISWENVFWTVRQIHFVIWLCPLYSVSEFAFWLHPILAVCGNSFYSQAYFKTMMMDVIIIFDNKHHRKILNTTKKHDAAETVSCFLELLTRFELVTSSLPRKCSTNWAITAIMLHLSVWKRITLITKCFLLEYFVFCFLVNQRILL